MGSYGLSDREATVPEVQCVYSIQLIRQVGLLQKTEQGRIAMLSFFIWLLGIQLKFLRFAEQTNPSSLLFV